MLKGMKLTHCKRGHLRSPENLDSGNNCRECAGIRHRAMYAAKRKSLGKAYIPDLSRRWDSVEHTHCLHGHRLSETRVTWVNKRGIVRHRCRLCVIASQRKNRINLKLSGKWQERIRVRNLKKRFGISAEQYENLLRGQGGVCAGCKTKPVELALSVDHNHNCCAGRTSCGKCIRGLLCASCNLAIGAVKDSVNILNNLQHYLEECHNVEWKSQSARRTIELFPKTGARIC